MPLELVTGPANAEKAGHVLGGVRAAVAAGRDPLLVVPTFEDVGAYRHELAAGGVVFGLRVERFGELESEIARRAGVPRSPRVAGDATRRRLAATAARRAGLVELAASAATAGFAAALVRLFDELAVHRVGAGRFIAAMAAWGAAQPGRAAFAAELGRLHGAYRDGLRDLGREDAETLAYRAHDALRAAPGRWGGAPVFLYGFDDLDLVQRDAVETLVRAGAEVVVSLPFEPGRDDVFRARAGTFAELEQLADRRVRLPAGDPPSEPVALVLHHLERTLLGPPVAPPAAEVVPRAVTLLSGGGERAELELVAREVAAELADGTAPEAVAVVVPDLPVAAPLVAEVLRDAGIPFALVRQVPLGHTALGRGVLALARAALDGGTVDDLLTWLRTPGFLERPELADRLERDVRVHGIRDVAGARARWEAEHPSFALAELDRVARAARTGLPALCDVLLAVAERLFAGPWRGTAAQLPDPARADARVLSGLRALLGEARALAEAAPRVAGGPPDLLTLIADQQVWLGDPPGPGRVTVADPWRLRARRVEVLALTRLQEGTFPAPGTPEAFLGDPERRALNAAAGLRLSLPEDQLDLERYLLYTMVSRPTRRLVLSWHAGDDEGQPRGRSLFVDDVLDQLGAAAPDPVARRLGELAGTPGAHGRLLEAALTTGAAPEAGAGPLRDAAILDALRTRPAWSAGGLEAWTRCPVRWFVERFLRPDALEPDPEAMARGSLVHDVLQRTFEQLGGALTPAGLPRARELALAAIAAFAPGAPLPMAPLRREAVLRRLEIDVLRYLDLAAASGSRFAPAHFELGFGTSRDELGPVDLGGGLLLSGRIDRVDLAPGGDAAIVVDYKGRSAQPAQARWLDQGRVQAGLYAIALGSLLGVEVVGALYQPIGAREDQRPRGFLLEDADPGRSDIVANDRVDRDRRDDLLDGVRERAQLAVREITAGALEPRPATCGPRGGCAYPSICRCGDT
jgi:ATP-dependent helicase/DNAse subunit B